MSRLLNKWVLIERRLPNELAHINFPSTIKSLKEQVSWEPFKTYILPRRSKGCINSNILFDEIVAKGYSGKSTILSIFMQPHRESLISKACIRYETPPCKQAQVDWGEFKLTNVDGVFVN